MTDTIHAIALVGHCGPDSFALRSFVSSTLRGSRVEFVNNQRELESRRGEFHAALVNRVLDGSFTTESGIELIRILGALDDGPALMLITNFPEAAAEAEAAGAVPGFGKAELNTDRARERLRAAVSARA